MTPLWRASSWPLRKIAIVGTAWTLRREVSAWASSMFTLATLKSGDSLPAAFSRIGPSVRQGPHQGAQKSTSTGMSDLPTNQAKRASVTVSGTPVSSGSWHLPHLALAALSASARRAAGSRFTPPQ